MNPLPTLSIVTTFYNEGKVLAELASQISQVLDPLHIDYELLFINDASTDDSLQVIQGLAKNDPRIKCVTMSRNFGYDECFLAGLQYSNGQAVVTMDSDLQDPPELLAELIQKWKAGSDIVHTTRTSREGENAFRMMITKFGYRLIQLSSKTEVPVDTGQFKLLSRRVVNELIRLRERDPYLRGLISWIGFKQSFVYYERKKRFAGETHARLLSAKTFNPFLSGLIAFSFLPLNSIIFLGLFVLSLATADLCWIIGSMLGGHELKNGSLIVFTFLILSGMQFLTTGFLGLYLGRIYNEVIGRPRHVVESSIGVEIKSTIPPNILQ